MRDVSAIGEALVTTVKGYVAPIVDRLSALEKSVSSIPAGPQGEPGVDGATGPSGKDAEPVDYSVVESFVAKALPQLRGRLARTERKAIKVLPEKALILMRFLNWSRRRQRRR